MNFSSALRLCLVLAVLVLKEQYVESADCSTLPGGGQCTRGSNLNTNCPLSSNPLLLSKCLPVDCTALPVPATCQCLFQPGPDNNCLVNPPKFCSCRANCQAAGAKCTAGSDTKCILALGNCKKDCTALGQVCQALPGFESVNSNTQCLLTQGGSCVAGTPPPSSPTTTPSPVPTTTPGPSVTPAPTTTPYYPPSSYYPPTSYYPQPYSYYPPAQQSYSNYPPMPYYQYQPNPYPSQYYYPSPSVPQYNQYLSSSNNYYPPSNTYYQQPYGKKK